MSNRLLLLALTLVAVVIGGVNLYLTAPGAVRAAHQQLDGQLARVAQALPGALDAAAERNLGLTSELAGAPEVQAALEAVVRGEGTVDQAVLDQVIGVADSKAEARGENDLRGLVVVATSRGAAIFRQGSGNEFTEESGLPLVKEALGGARGTAVASYGGAVYRIAAAPVGNVGAVAVGHPVDDAFATSLRETLGVDVTIVQENRVLATSLGARDRGRLAAAAAESQGATTFGFGKLPGETFTLFGLVDLPLFAPEAHAVRARVVRVPGLDGAGVILSAPAAAALMPVADAQKTTILLSGVILVVGLLFTALARSGGYDRADVETLAEVAERAAAGDKTARAAEFLPGDLGRLARSINKLAAARARAGEATEEGAGTAGQGEAAPAADLAEQFQFPTSGPVATELEAEPTPPPAVPSWTDEFNPPPLPKDVPDDGVATAYLSAEDAVAEPEPAETLRPAEPSGWSLRQQGENRVATLDHGLAAEPQAAPRPPPVPTAAPAEERNEADFSGLLDEPRPSPRAADPFSSGFREPEPPPAPAPAPIENPDATMVAAVPEALLQAIRKPAEPPRPEPQPVDPDEAHFQQVFREFLATRERCGETAAGISYEKFAAKLRKSRDDLVAKYGCRTVRFTVYEKDGRAALKAAPVRG